MSDRVVAAADALARAHEKRGGNAAGYFAYCSFCGGIADRAPAPICEVPHTADCLVAAYLRTRSQESA